MTTSTLLLAAMLTGPAQVSEDVYPINERKLSIPIRFDPAQRAKIQQVMLFVSRGRGQPWEQAAVRSPDQDSFSFSTQEDGIYWFSLVIVDNDGRRDPPDLYTSEPQLKVLIDTVKPVLRFTAAEWQGDQVIASWDVIEDYPSPPGEGLRLEYAWGDTSTPPERGWQAVPSGSVDRGQARFAAQGSGSGGTVWLRLAVTDLAGNQSSAIRPVSGRAPAGDVAREPRLGGGPSTVSSIPDPGELPSPSEPRSFPAERTVSHDVPAPPPAAMVESSPGANSVGRNHAMTSGEPREQNWEPRPSESPSPVAVSSDQPSPAYPRASSPAASSNSLAASSNVQVINVLQFDLGYSVEGSGPSGVGAVELWVTRDDGRTWSRWATDDDLQSPITVNLEGRHNPEPEGYYGFRVVVHSGAGLSKGPPVAGDAPDLRVYVDITKPVIKLWPPTADPRTRDTLLMRWEATDKNLAEKPIALEWSESPSGPWRPITAADQSVSGRASSDAHFGTPSVRIANTGRLSWRVPRDMPTHRVYLRASAIDRAGNEAIVVTPEPIEIDMNTPEARIQGIVGSQRP